MTTEQILSISNVFESRKASLKKALSLLSESQEAYQRFIELSEEAYRQDVVLHSKRGWATDPLITVESQKQMEVKAEIAKRWSERRFDQANAQVAEFVKNHLPGLSHFACLGSSTIE